VKVILSVIAGPHRGREYTFDGRDSFLVGRSKDAHFQLSYDDPYFSRRHFLIELNPPRCRLLDLKSRNGVSINGQKQAACELRDGDEIKAGNTIFRVTVSAPDPDAVHTLDLPPPMDTATIDREPVSAAEFNRNLVPGYYLQSELGRGGMGVVYRALRLADGIPAAVKLIIPAVSSTGAAEKFLREARILGQLQHRHVVKFLEAGETDSGLFIAMEFVDGPDAAQLAHQRGGQLNVRFAVRLICQVLNGLAHAHKAGFVHRDIKPHNILIGKENKKPVVKVADFGLARAFEASKLSGMTLHGEFGGTPAFMAPEQVTHYRDTKPAADQYSAAATLYYLLTGTYAFNLSNDITSLLVMIITDPPIPILERRADLPVELAEVIHTAMSREPTDRYASVTKFRAALLPFTE